jgi:hypothetical protein
VAVLINIAEYHTGIDGILSLTTSALWVFYVLDLEGDISVECLLAPSYID